MSMEVSLRNYAWQGQLTCDCTTIIALGELFGEILEHFQCSILVRLVLEEIDRSLETRLLPAILRAWYAV